MTLEINVKLSCKKDGIVIRGLDETFHLMLFWDKAKPIGSKEVYEEISNHIKSKLTETDNTLTFVPLVRCTNSTYGILDDWLNDYVFECRKKYPWLHTEKDLPNHEPVLFAHISRRELAPDSPLKLALENPSEETKIIFKITL